MRLECPVRQYPGGYKNNEDKDEDKPNASHNHPRLALVNPRTTR